MIVGFELGKMVFDRHSDKLEYMCRLREWLKNGSNKKLLALAHCHVQKPFVGYHLICDIENFECELDLKVSQLTKDRLYFADEHSLKIFLSYRSGLCCLTRRCRYFETRCRD